MTRTVSSGASNAMSKMDEPLKRGSNDIGCYFEEAKAKKKQKARHEEEVREEVRVIVQEDAEIEGQKTKQQDSIVIQLMESSSALMVENPEPKSEDHQESMDLDPSTSLPSSAPLKKYDVFLSFRGADSRKDFLSHLHHELRYVRGLQTFMDDKELELGAPIYPSLLKAIEESNFAIVVLSKDYAQSAWCLEELTKICECMKDNNRIIPLFYHVEPTDVRYQKCSFRDAFTNHVKNGWHSSEQLQRWKKALETVANFSGCNAKDYKTEREVVEAIVESVCGRVRPIGIESIISSRDFGDFEVFEATREAMDNVMKALEDENVTIIGVYGMPGIGKTTMVEHVGVEAQKKGLFRQVTRAVISQKPNLWKIQGRLASMLGVTLRGADEFERACELMSMIRRRERILIILDDIWTKRELSDIGIPGPKELKSRNSKLLLTTRNKDVCDSMHCQPRIPIDILTEQDSWKLFEKNTGKSFEQTTKFYRVARKVARECAGLPLALKAVAKALGNKDLDQWRGACKRLKASKTPYPEDKGDVFKSIKLSYDYLETNDSKSCFLLCCLFPEDYDIQIEDLLKYGIGKGLFQESDMQEARAAVHSVVQSLKDSNLLLDGKMDRGCVRMHDVIRDVGFSISLSKDGHRQFYVRAGWELEDWPTIDAHEYYTAISLMRNKIPELPEVLEFPELQILLLQSNSMNKILDSSFKHLTALRVLDISETSISLLPSSSNLLTSLHTLYLDGCLSMESNISILGQLKELKILSMREFPREKLPKEIGELTKLRMLDFTSESVGIVPCNVIGNLSKLEELYMQCNFVDWGSKVEGSEVKGSVVEESKAVGAGEETTALFDELTSLLHLRILKVFMSDAKCMHVNVRRKLKWINFDICISGDPSIRKQHLDSSSSLDYARALTVDITMDTLQKWFIDAVTKRTEKLQYIKCQDLGNILMEYDWGRLHKLKHLSVIGPNEKLKELMNTTIWIQNEPVFQNLEELHLVEVNCLKELCVGELPNESLCKLRLLKVTGCHKLMNALLQSNLLQRLQNLEILICEEMDVLEYVFACEVFDAEQITLRKLTEMRLENLVNLIKIWNGPAPHAVFHHVKILVVSGCFKLKYLFTSEVAQCLHELEDLRVEVCQRLERVIEASEETVNNKIVFPKLKILALKQLPKLTRFYGSTGSGTNDEENIEFPLLEHSHVERCNSFKSPAKDMLVSVMKKQLVLIPMQESDRRETPTLSRRR
ncbi:putative toll-like receptor, P-loop containing nucleoside triphosphate hydrolase [Rosa chinensis]|uniref:Putative toll-like receptor, P-loop containing nucleoside triphosphate hydrolase n=1 Tax=Rosa chinensis TaxID=74649 RepID=A0A2P6QMP4_ROSCH|nr:probable disease resistance protein At4g27220 isoform X2 [Rosa chinensis]PRQ35463.1 putative toll-like receptor, P-loop containing nucleoside triphosphate hydrolase [Rosa chinensis]